MRDFFDYTLIELLPFWQQVFALATGVAWPVALVFVVSKLRPLITQMLSDRGFSFEGFGAQFKVDERKNAQIESAVGAAASPLGGNFRLPRTEAIDEEEKIIVGQLDKLPADDRNTIIINALAIERLEKRFALVYASIFGSQWFLMQRLNELGGTATLADAEKFFSEVKLKFSEFADWDFNRYSAFLVHHGLIAVNSAVELKPAGRDFIQFVVRLGLSTDKPL